MVRGVVLVAGCATMAPAAAAAPASSPAPGDAAVFVANKRGNTLTRIDFATGQKTAEVPSCANPHELAVAPDGRHIALACYGGTSVDIFQSTTLEKVASINLGEHARPHGIVWQQDAETGRDEIFVTAEGRQSAFVIAYPLGEAPDLVEVRTDQRGSHMIAVSPDGAFAWTMDLGSGTATLLDLTDARKLRSAAIGVEPEGISLAPDGAALWVSARGSNRAFKLDPMTLEILEEVATGRFPLRIAVRPQGDVVITSDLQDGSLTVIDTATGQVVRSIVVSGPAEAEKRQQVTIVWSDDGERIYVAETGTDTIAEVEFASGKVLRRLRAGEGGDGLAVLARSGREGG